jgi:hypothetical protein
MSTKLTGLGDDGMPTTAGDTGTLVTDGSLVLGNSETDSVTFNADVASNFKPDASNTYTLGSPTKTWSALYVDEGIVFRSKTGTGSITMGFTDPGDLGVQLQMPNQNGTLALHGLLPSYLGFGKNYSQSAPLSDYELTSLNGSTNGQGYRMPVAGEVTHLSAQFDVVNATGNNQFNLSLWKNGVDQNVSLIINNSSTGDTGNSIVLNPSVPFADGDRLTLKMSLVTAPNTTFTVDDLACLIRVLN